MAPNSSGTAKVDALMIEQAHADRFAHPSCGCHAMQQRHDHRLRAAQSEPQRKRQRHQGGDAGHERKQRVDATGDEQGGGQHFELRTKRRGRSTASPACTMNVAAANAARMVPMSDADSRSRAP